MRQERSQGECKSSMESQGRASSNSKIGNRTPASSKRVQFGGSGLPGEKETTDGGEMTIGQSTPHNVDSRGSTRGMQHKEKRTLHIPLAEGQWIDTADRLRMSPRDFLRIGKVQKELEEPLTDAQVQHRDRSYIIHKLNKTV